MGATCGTPAVPRPISWGPDIAINPMNIGITRTSERSSHQVNPLIVVRHRHVLEDIPKPSELCRVSGRNGGQFSHTAHAACYTQHWWPAQSRFPLGLAGPREPLAG